MLHPQAEALARSRQESEMGEGQGAGDGDGKSPEGSQEEDREDGGTSHHLFRFPWDVIHERKWFAATSLCYVICLGYTSSFCVLRSMQRTRYRLYG